MDTGMLKRSAGVFGQLAYAKVTRRRIPVRVALQVTKICPMRCNYCYANFETYKQVKDKTKEELFALIDELYARGTRWLWFLGGEPMVREDLGEIIDYAKNKGIFCDMNSNGILINERNIGTVKKLDAVSVSIDGDRESNDYYRGQGSYDKAVRAVELLRKNGVLVRIHAILTRRTVRSLDHLVALAARLGTTFNYSEVLRRERDPDHILTVEESREFYSRYMELKRKGAPIAYSLLSMEYLRNWPKGEQPLIYKDEQDTYPKGSYVPCLLGDLQCFLDVDGKLYACNGTWDDGLNMYEVGFQKAWDYLAQRKCASCRCIGAVELHLLLGLSPAYILHGVKSVLSLAAAAKP